MSRSVKIRTFVVSFFVIFASLLLALPLVHAQTPAKPSSNKITQVKTQRKHERGDTVGMVNGVVITYGDFNAIMSGYLKTFVARSKNNVVSDSLYSVVVDSSWNKAICDVLIEREIKKRKLSMTSIEVREAITKDPPDYLREQFSDSVGKYHPENLQQSLSDPRNDTVVQMLLAAEQVRLETERLIENVAEQAHAKNDSQHVFEIWLKKSRIAARIVDRRTAFGFY